MMQGLAYELYVFLHEKACKQAYCHSALACAGEWRPLTLDALAIGSHWCTSDLQLSYQWRLRLRMHAQGA